MILKKNKIGYAIGSLYKKLLPLFSVGFPGGYKFLVIMVVTLFAGSNIADSFSKGYFWVGLLVSFSGLPVAALMVSNNHNMLPKHRFYFILISTVIAFLIAYFTVLNTYPFELCLIIFVAALFLSYYETAKRYFLNIGDFIAIFIASTVSLLMFLALFITTKDDAVWLIFLVFFSLLFPMAAMLVINTYKGSLGKPSAIRQLIKGFLHYILSSMTSTSLMAALPLVVISEIGNGFSSQIAQVFSFSSLMYLLPRALSAKHIPDMRANGITHKSVEAFFYRILKFELLIIIFSLPVFYAAYDEWLVFWILFSAMQTSQLSLPFSNVLMVHGDSRNILKVNYISASAFVFLCFLLTLWLEPGMDRAEWLLFFFWLLQVLKLFLSYGVCKKYVY